MNLHFTECTAGYWQVLISADQPLPEGPPWQLSYPARWPAGRVLLLPIRQLTSDPRLAEASLICNQASLKVVDALAALLGQALAPCQPDLFIGLPTLGLALSPGVA